MSLHIFLWQSPKAERRNEGRKGSYDETQESDPASETFEAEGKLNTVRCHNNMVNFLKNVNKRHPVGLLLRRGMGCLLWIQHMIYILPQFLQLSMQYFTILDRIIIALDCIFFFIHLLFQKFSTLLALDVRRHMSRFPANRASKAKLWLFLCCWPGKFLEKHLSSQWNETH